MIIIIHFFNNSRPSEYADNPGRIIFRKGDAYRSGGFCGKIVSHGVEKIGGILQKFIEVNIENDEPWIEAMPKKIENDWELWVRSQKTKIKAEPQKIQIFEKDLPPKQKQISPLEPENESPNFHDEYKTNKP